MRQSNQNTVPLGLVFGKLTKMYIAILSHKLRHLPIERFYYACWLIAENNGNLTQQDLVNLLQSDKVTVNRIVRYLEKSNAIYRLKNLQDKRSVNLHISEEFKTFVPQIEKALKETDQLVLKHMGKPENFLCEILQMAKELEVIPAESISLFYERINNTNSNNKDD